jgi:hypothetical protein
MIPPIAHQGKPLRLGAARSRADHRWIERSRAGAVLGVDGFKVGHAVCGITG